MVDSKRTTTKRKGNPNWKKGGPSPNPKGAPKRGMSTAEAYQWAISLKPEEMAGVLSIGGSNDLSRAFKQMPQNIQIKYLMAARIIAAIMFEPQPGLVNHVIDRIDGPLETNVKHSGDETRPIRIVLEYADDHIAPPASGAADDQAAGEPL